MSERLKLYLAEHLEQAADLYLLASEVLDQYTEYGVRARGVARAGDDDIALLRLRRVRDAISDGLNLAGPYLSR